MAYDRGAKKLVLTCTYWISRRRKTNVPVEQYGQGPPCNQGIVTGCASKTSGTEACGGWQESRAS